MTMLHEQTVKVTVENTSQGPTRYEFTPSIASEDDLPPVVFVVYTGAATLQDYFTPEQADEMAAAWTEVARRARVANGLASDEESSVFETYGAYELHRGGHAALTIRRRDIDDRKRTVATVESREQWRRFVSALRGGADEVAAVHAIDVSATSEATA